MLLPLLHFHHISTSNTLFGTLSLCWRAVAVSRYSLYRHRLPEYALEGPYFEGCVFTQVMYDKKKKRYLKISSCLFKISCLQWLQGFELTTFQCRPLPPKSPPTESDLASLGSRSVHRSRSHWRSVRDALGVIKMNPINGESFNPQPPTADVMMLWLGEQSLRRPGSECNEGT